AVEAVVDQVEDRVLKTDVSREHGYEELLGGHRFRPVVAKLHRVVLRVPAWPTGSAALVLDDADVCVSTRTSVPCPVGAGCLPRPAARLPSRCTLVASSACIWRFSL